MVDAVITWVDGCDKDHQRKRFLWADKESPKRGEKSTARLATRWRSVFEIFYCIHLIRKNAPWIDRIYLVTDNQRPSWLTEAMQKRLDVNLVDHQTIFSGNEWALPTFNSTAIETMLHRIPDLSERYLYFNDDIFLIRRISEKDYFSGDKPKWRGWRRGINTQGLRYVVRWVATGIKKDGFIGGRQEKEILGIPHLFSLGHAPQPFVKSYARQVIEKDNRLESNISHRFRAWDGFTPATLVANAGITEGRALKGADDWESIEPKHGAQGIQKRMLICKRNKNIKTVCLQSIDMMPNVMQKESESFLREFLEV
ncbi:hypothetical protein LRF89_10530 [Halorhodospira sp. 9621]|uniref:stealth family protein n=1 Tax=Halorhodospira sp. 9621 TaxID=2899135 RepID=UPI001EE7F241|nr:stealth family protein [Halorhodospira sp. 9621]MCG5533871.1 hypothetical protein [Halorhodospira sp. 9621]